MKKNSMLALLLASTGAVAFLTAYIWTARVEAVPIKVSIKDLSAHGLDLISPADPSFPQFLSTYLKDESRMAIQDVEPTCVFLRNRSGKHLIGYVLKWEMLRATGKPRTHFSAYDQPGVLLGYSVGVPTPPGQGHIIAPNALKLFSVISPIDRDETAVIGSVGSRTDSTSGLDLSAKPIERAKSELRQITQMTISLDAAVFADGTFVGPNTSRYFERLEAQIDAKQDLLSKIATADSSSELDQVFKSLEDSTPEDASPNYLEASSEALYRFFARRFAREILDVKKAYGKEKAATHYREIHKMAKPRLKRTTD